MDELERMEREERLTRRLTHSYYSNMQNRINLQSVGCMIRDGSEANVNYSSFFQRKERAYEMMKKHIAILCGPENTGKI